MASSGVHSFDFLHGKWKVHNKKIRNNRDPLCNEWIEFDGLSDVVPVLEGLGNLDRYFVSESRECEAFEAMTLRLFDPSTQTWRIWWSSTRAPGVLEPPVIGNFVGDHGLFNCHDLFDGTEVEVRFEWQADAMSPTWQQSFSWDSGVTWKLNWTMDFSPLESSRD